jgi:hypothetical protein
MTSTDINACSVALTPQLVYHTEFLVVYVSSHRIANLILPQVRPFERFVLLAQPSHPDDLFVAGYDIDSTVVNEYTRSLLEHETLCGLVRFDRNRAAAWRHLQPTILKVQILEWLRPINIS